MEGKIRVVAVTICVVFVVMVAKGNVNAQAVGGGNLYTCFGGCYNQCFLLQQEAGAHFPCYFQCLGNCISPTAGTFPYYCQIGCSSQLCLPLRSDGAAIESCLGSCGRACGAN